MNEFSTHVPARRRQRRLMIAAGIGVLGLASAGFAASGGIALVKGWFVTTQVNGEVVDSREITPDENGNAKFTVNTGSGTADVNVQQQPDGQKQVTVDLSSGSGTFTITSGDAAGATTSEKKEADKTNDNGGN